MLIDDSYSVIEHTTSESGAQGVPGAWLARLGFVLFGFAVVAITRRSWGRWKQPGTSLHLLFALCMLLVAVFSARSWDPVLAYDVTEDAMHSVAATAMGFAFALGVVAVAMRRRWRVSDVVAVAASVVLPLGMALYEPVSGVLQRTMFVIAYLWYGSEAIRVRER